MPLKPTHQRFTLVCLAALSLLTPLVAAQERPFDTTPCGLLLHPDKYDEGMRSGYGRMGCCSLLVIEEVAKVAPDLEEPVDFSPISAVSPRNLMKGCTVSQVQGPPQEDEDQLERKSLEDEYHYLHDPKKV